ncbi:MAG TPA: rhomboid family intramembrane serine protease [Anaerolineales bacterium]
MNEPPASLPPETAPAPAAPPARVQVSLPFSVPVVTYSILALTVLVFILQKASVPAFGYVGHGLDTLEFYGARINELIRQGQIWRFLTPVLLHASVPHILFNMYALYSLGVGMERYFGHGRFLLLYLLGGFAGNVLSFIVMPDSSFSVGASTSVFGLIAAEGVFLFQNRNLLGRQANRALSNIAFLIVINLLIGLAPGIDIFGHIGGLLGGLTFAWFAGPRWEVEGIQPYLRMVDRREGRDVILGAGLVVILFGALAVWGMFK